VRDVVDGEARLSTTVEVRFDRPFELAESDLPLSSHFEFAVPVDDGSGPRRVFVQVADPPAQGSRSLTVHVDALLPVGTTISVTRTLFRAREEGMITADVESDLDPVQALLAQQPLTFADDAFLEGSNVPAPGPEDGDVEAMRAHLAADLEVRQVPEDVRARTLQAYDAIPAEVVPAPRARAALAALTGTFAEPAIANLTTDDNCTGQPAALVTFQPPPDGPNLLARVSFDERGRRVLSLNPILAGEPIVRLMSIIAHEAIHCDPDSSLREEVAATAFDSLLYLLLVATYPESSAGGTALSRDLNVDALALINSGRRLPESIGILPSYGITQVLPGTNDQSGSFAEFIARAYAGLPEASPPERLADLYAAALASSAGAEAGPAFDLVYLDELLGRYVDLPLLVAAIAALNLVPGG
jgi:hypothetical protein